MECVARRRRAIPPPIAYKPELARCTHEASEAVSRGVVKGSVGIRGESSILCTQAIPAMQRRANLVLTVLQYSNRRQIVTLRKWKSS